MHVHPAILLAQPEHRAIKQKKVRNQFPEVNFLKGPDLQNHNYHITDRIKQRNIYVHDLIWTLGPSCWQNPSYAYSIINNKVTFTLGIHLKFHTINNTVTCEYEISKGEKYHLSCIQLTYFWSETKLSKPSL